MKNWNKIRKTILFEHLGDWKQIVIADYDLQKHDAIIKFVAQTYGIIPAENPDRCDSFKAGSVQIYMYQNKDFQFDFNPNEITKAEAFELIIELMKRLSQVFQSKVIVLQEDFREYPLVTVDKEEVHYDYGFWNKFDRNNLKS